MVLFILFLLESPLPVVLIMTIFMIQVLKRQEIFSIAMSGKATADQKIEACYGLIWIMAMLMTYIFFVILYGTLPIIWIALYLIVVALVYRLFKRKP